MPRSVTLLAPARRLSGRRAKARPSRAPSPAMAVRRSSACRTEPRSILLGLLMRPPSEADMPELAQPDLSVNFAQRTLPFLGRRCMTDCRSQSAALFSWRSALLRSSLASTTRHVLLTLACHMDRFGAGCFPSTRTLAVETALSRRTVETHLRLAKGAEWIAIGRKTRVGQGWRRSEYRISWPPNMGKKVPHLKQEREETVSPPSIRGGETDALKGGATDAQNVGKEVSPSTSITSSCARSSAGGGFTTSVKPPPAPPRNGAGDGGGDRYLPDFREKMNELCSSLAVDGQDYLIRKCREASPNCSLGDILRSVSLNSRRRAKQTTLLAS